MTNQSNPSNPSNSTVPFQKPKNTLCPKCHAATDQSLLSRNATRYECESVWCFETKNFRERSRLCEARELLILAYPHIDPTAIDPMAMKNPLQKYYINTRIKKFLEGKPRGE
jgi:hypothetical protein